MFVLFWAESSLHDDIAGQATEILGVVDNITELDPETVITLYILMELGECMTVLSTFV